MEKLSLPKIAYDAIIDFIMAGTLKLGQPLPQIQLTKLLSMSRTPVREAMAALERDGILVKEGRKYSVCYISRKEVQELYSVRKNLEGMAAWDCARLLTPEIAKALTSQMKKIKKLTFSENVDPYALSTQNGNLHLIIAQGSDNRYNVRFLNEVLLKLKIVRAATLNSYERRNEEFEEHTGIVEAILERDSRKARVAMEQHRINILKFTEENTLPALFPDDE